MEMFSSGKSIPSSHFFLYTFHQGKSEKNLFQIKINFMFFCQQPHSILRRAVQLCGLEIPVEAREGTTRPLVVGPETVPSIFLTYTMFQIKGLGL